MSDGFPNTDRRLHIYYRHVHVKAELRSRDPNKKRPPWFSYEGCFRNLLETIRQDRLGHRVRINVVYDGSADEARSDFVIELCNRYQVPAHIYLTSAGSDMRSLLTTFQLANDSDLPDRDLIYFLENDYAHQPGWTGKVFELYESGHKFDFVSLYDHRDKYHLPMYVSLTAKLLYSRTHHWRTAPSTCASFILEKAALRRDYDVFSSGLTDYYLFTKLVGERGRTLLTPLPGLSTHAMAEYLSPAVDWEKLVC